MTSLTAHSDLDDLFDVQKELILVSAKWRSIGIALRLKPNVLDGIETRYSGDPPACLTSTVTEWLNRNYNVKRFGEPTWQALVKAVGDPAGGATWHLQGTWLRGMRLEVCLVDRYIDTLLE